MMTSFLVIALWWASGIVPMVYFSWEGRDAFTWGILATCLIVGGILGPILLIVLGLVMLTQSGFWDVPVFGRSKKSAEGVLR